MLAPTLSSHPSLGSHPSRGEPGSAPGSVTLALRLFEHTQGRFLCRQLVGQHRGNSWSCFAVCFVYLNFLSWPGASEGVEKSLGGSRHLLWGKSQGGAQAPALARQGGPCLCQSRSAGRAPAAIVLAAGPWFMALPGPCPWCFGIPPLCPSPPRVALLARPVSGGLTPAPGTGPCLAKPYCFRFVLYNKINFYTPSACTQCPVSPGEHDPSPLPGLCEACLGCGVSEETPRAWAAHPVWGQLQGFRAGAEASGLQARGQPGAPWCLGTRMPLQQVPASGERWGRWWRVPVSLRQDLTGGGKREAWLPLRPWEPCLCVPIPTRG